MAFINVGRILRRKLRSKTCWILLFSAIFWTFLNLALVRKYSIKETVEDYVEYYRIDSFDDDFQSNKVEGFLVKTSNKSIAFPISYRYKSLRKWRSAPKVEEQPGKPGELGTAVKVPTDMHDLMKKRFKENEFNVIASDMMSVNRSLHDLRHINCTNKLYPSMLPTTSIVIVFHNEAWSTLLRTIWSVINRSPRTLIKQIILVDDASERDYLGKKLEDHVATLPVETFVLRTGKRSGLIKARLLGAKHVTGEVITFLDAHCECMEGWLEPLLARIVQNRRTVVCPAIDTISDETFEYYPAAENIWGGFSWKLTFKWRKIPERELRRRHYDDTAPIRTPTMAGGIFSIDKSYFYEIGSYDDGMDIWGGENMEMSFRIWQCGGILEIIPCSRVGHVFRSYSPYTFPGGAEKVIMDNTARVAEVWLDEWKKFFYASRIVDANYKVNVSERLTLREKLQCKSFRWYLQNIYPESLMPLEYNYLGKIRNNDTNMCLDTLSRSYQEKVGIASCDDATGYHIQIFVYTKRQQIIHDDLCLDSSSVEGPVTLAKCDTKTINQVWFYDKQYNIIIHTRTGSCLQMPSHDEELTTKLRPCDFSKSQQWLMQSEFKRTEY